MEQGPEVERIDLSGLEVHASVQRVARSRSLATAMGDGDRRYEDQRQEGNGAAETQGRLPRREKLWRVLLMDASFGRRDQRTKPMEASGRDQTETPGYGNGLSGGARP